MFCCRSSSLCCYRCSNHSYNSHNTDKSFHLAVVSRRTIRLTEIVGVEEVLCIALSTKSKILTENASLRTLYTHSGFVVKVPRKGNASRYVELFQVRLSVTSKTLTFVVASEAVVGTVSAAVIQSVREVSFKASFVAEAVSSEEVAIIAVSAVVERRTGLAFSRTGRTDSVFVVEVAFLGYTSLRSRIHLPKIFKSVA